jgi:hypothetical protein
MQGLMGLLIGDMTGMDDMAMMGKMVLLIQK